MTNHTTIDPIPTKICSKCGETKPRIEYYRDKRSSDGLYSHCKACHYKVTSAYLKTDKGKEIAARSSAGWYYERGGQQVERTRNSTDDAKEKRRQYEQTEEGKAAARRKMEKRKLFHPEKLKAKTAVRDAVVRGDLPHISTRQCVECGNRAVEYHHHSYEPEFWLDVAPLCKKCHAATYTTPYE